MSETQRNVGNESQAQAIADAAKEEKREQQQELSEAERAAREITEREEEKTIHLRVNGKRVPFHTIGGALSDVEETMQELTGKDEEDLTPEEQEKNIEAQRRVDEVLAEKCKWRDEEKDIFTYDWWRSKFDTRTREEYVAELMDGGIEGNRQ